jgi:hypothetical protein
MDSPSPSKPSQEPSIFDEFDIQSQNHQKHIRQARMTIFIVAGIQIFFGMVSGFQFGGNTGWFVFGITAFIALIFIALGIWTRKKPFTAILIALILYSGLLITDLLIQPAIILKGILVKILIIVFLLRGLKKARDAERWASAFKQ